MITTRVATIGVAQLLYQQTQTSSSSSSSLGMSSYFHKGFTTSDSIADNTIVSAELKDGQAVKSADIVDGQVKAQDLDSLILDGTSSKFQVTERTRTVLAPQTDFLTIIVQCNSDEVVIVGGFSTHLPNGIGVLPDLNDSKKDDNGWSVT